MPAQHAACHTPCDHPSLQAGLGAPERRGGRHVPPPLQPVQPQVSFRHAHLPYKKSETTLLLFGVMPGLGDVGHGPDMTGATDPLGNTDISERRDLPISWHVFTTSYPSPIFSLVPLCSLSPPQGEAGMFSSFNKCSRHRRELFVGAGCGPQASRRPERELGVHSVQKANTETAGVWCENGAVLALGTSPLPPAPRRD